MKSFADGQIEVYFGPTELGAADELDQAIVELIGNAGHSLGIAVLIDSKPARVSGVTTATFG